MEEFGPEHTKAIVESEYESDSEQINKAIKAFKPVISIWLRRAHRHGFKSTARTEEEAFNNFCKLYGVDNT